MKAYSCRIGSSIFRLAEWGDGPRTLIAIHGLTGNHLHFQRFAESFSDDYRIIAYDVRGRGDSSAADGPSSLAKHAEDAIALIESLQIRMPVLVGHSMGAFIAMIAGSAYRNVAGIVCLDGGGLLTRAGAAKLVPALSRLDRTYSSIDEYEDSVRPMYEAMGLPWNPIIQASVRYEVAEESPSVVRFKGDSLRIHEDLESAIEAFPAKDIYSKIQCPVLTVAAKGNMGSEPVYPEEAYDLTRQHTKDLQYFASESNHYTLVMNPESELLSVVRNFLARVTGQTFPGEEMIP